MSGFDSSDEEPGSGFDTDPLKIDWFDLSKYGFSHDQLGIGPLPGCRFKDTWRSLERDVEQLRMGDTKHVFCFCSRGELAKYRAEWLISELAGADVMVHQHSFLDGGVPQISLLTTILEELKTCLADGHKTYMHCFGGLGRSGLVAACLLQCLDEEISAEDSIRLVRELRGPGAVQSVKQYNYVIDFRSLMREYEEGGGIMSRSVSR